MDSLPCLSMSVSSLSWPRFCVLRTFLGLFGAIIVSCVISLLYFLMSSIAFFLMVLHISAYSFRCLSSPFLDISRRFLTRARVGDDIVEYSGLLIALPAL